VRPVLVAVVLVLAAADPPAGNDGPAGATGATATPTRPAGATATLVVEVEGLKDDAGTVHAALHASADGFPTRPEKALRQADAPITGGRARLTFDGLVPGGYAVSAYHDENGNGKLDTGFLGIPSEGLAASNDARGFMGPPSFEKARVEVAPGTNLIVVRMSY
jgi:uncharacterized protein (DUF2141 family)